MAHGRKPASGKNGGGGNLGFEETLWAAADKLRGQMDASEYKHVVLGLIFLKYISDAFERRTGELTTLAADPASDFYVAEPDARYEVLNDRDAYQIRRLLPRRRAQRPARRLHPRHSACFDSFQSATTSVGRY